MPVTNAASRQKRYRARTRAGLVMLKITVSEIDLAEALIAAGFLRAADADDRAKLVAALEHVVQLWTCVTRNGEAAQNLPWS